MIPDDTAGRPLTPGEQAAIADLERRFLLEAPLPIRARRPVRIARTRPAQSAVPLVVLLGTTLLLVGVLILSGGGLLGGAAVLASVLGTAAVWPLLPAGFGGPVRPTRRVHRMYRPVPRHR